MHKLVLLRHGESVWNEENRFTGWTDVDLTTQGIEEADRSARLLMDEAYGFDVVYTSVLKRAIRTMWIVMDRMDLMWLPVHRHWRLNERHYGALQGLNKAETAAKHGAEQVHTWRRSYATAPPPLDETDQRHPRHDPRYRDVPDHEIPASESLKDTVERFLPHWKEAIAPTILAGRRVLIVAHGNSLRALVKHLDQVPDDEIPALNIPTGIPLVYELDERLEPLGHHYLGDPEEAERAARAVARQGERRKI